MAVSKSTYGTFLARREKWRAWRAMMACPDELITTRISIRDQLAAKRRAIAIVLSQLMIRCKSRGAIAAAQSHSWTASPVQDGLYATSSAPPTWPTAMPDPP